MSGSPPKRSSWVGWDVGEWKRRAGGRAALPESFQGRHKDEKDALTCTLIPALHGTRADALIPPPTEAPTSEGWIWLPKDALGDAA